MKVHSLAVALVWAAAGIGASATFAGTLAVLTEDDSTAVFGPAKLSNLQDTGGSAKLGASAATLGMDALRGASGNIGVNLAAGALNAQANQIALIDTPKAEIATQQSVHTIAQLTGSSTAELGAGALAGMSGNIGVNIASGVGNAQFNGLVVH
ncbi:hypothetical protein [Paraburkholderia lacunae]|uniref:Adhesin n=1 Tax=Paraburkholderia lacunae TaxID=2211104 RepID=A0A370NFP5_9BURK|nr:hypothetical protein [Paraburkholderia lacunae]RDK04413.1 hypothetical protein DLM46_00560 [Paraburkholderia lacunae]